MRHEFTRRCITLGSALAMGLLAVTSSLRAEESGAEPKQKALIAFKMDFLSRFKKDEPTTEQPTTGHPVGPTSEVVPVNALEPLPAGTAKTHAVPASNAPAAGQYPSVLPPSAPPVQLASGQFPLPPVDQMPFQTAQSPVVVMMPAGWQPDGNFTFAPRTVLSPEVPAEHWPTSQRNPLGDDSRKGLFSWPQIARKITNSTVGEPEPRPAPVEPQPTSSRALFAVGPAQPQTMPAQPQMMQSQAMPAVPQTVAAPVMPAQPQAMPRQSQALFPAPAPQAAAVATAPAQAVEAQPASKALFAPQPKQPEPQVEEESKSRALLSLLSKPMKKPATASPSTGSRALFALGRKADEPAAAPAPAPAVVPQYSAETPLPPDHSMQPVPPTVTVEPGDPELQPPAPPTVAHPLPGKFETAKSDDPKMKWRSKGAPEPVVERAAVAKNVSQPAPSNTAAIPAGEEVSKSPAPATTAAVVEESLVEQPLAEEQPKPARHTHAAHGHGQHPQRTPDSVAEPVSHERSLLGKHFQSVASQTPRNANDRRDPWRRQAERDAAAAAEKQVEQPQADSKAILPNVAALFPAYEKPSRPMPTHSDVPAKTHVTTVAATQDTAAPSHPVRQANGTSARAASSYYADPWEKELEAELAAIEKRQIGAVSNRRAAVARQAAERGVEPSARQPRVPFEADEFEQEKALQRRAAKTAKVTETARTKATAPAGSPSNGARLAEQKSQKSYRRLSGDDLKQGLTRPLAIFGEMTKLPGPLKSAVDKVERYEEEPQLADSRDEAMTAEFEDEQPEAPRPMASQRSEAKRPRAYELRQQTAAVASTKRLEDRELLTSDDESRSDGNTQRGGRRQVQRSARPSRMAEDAADDSGAEPVDDLETSEVVIADNGANDEAKVKQPARPAVQIRNKHGNRVKIYNGSAMSADASGEE